MAARLSPNLITTQIIFPEVEPGDQPPLATAVSGPAVVGPARLFQEQQRDVVVIVVVATEHADAAPGSLKFKAMLRRKAPQCISLTLMFYKGQVIHCDPYKTY